MRKIVRCAESSGANGGGTHRKQAELADGFAFAFDEYTKKDCFFSPLLVHEVGKHDHDDRQQRRRRTEGSENP